MTDNSDTSKEMQIKSHGWHTVTLTGNIMTGDTFACKEFIKKYLNGKWYAPRSGWIVDLNAVAKYSNESGTTLMSK